VTPSFFLDTERWERGANSIVSLSYTAFYKIKLLVIVKGIVSRDFGLLFLIYLDRYEVPNRAGSGLFFILRKASYSNFKKKLVLSVYKI
jgi:hypothetical protein